MAPNARLETSPTDRSRAPGRRAARARETDERILSAALQSFGTKGYDATSLDQLAGELGVTKQTILYHHPSKAALLDAVVDRASADGTLLRGEVLSRWQEFVGTGELLKSLESKVSWLRDRVSNAVRGQPQQATRVSVAVESGLQTLILEHAEAAAEQSDAAWRTIAAGRVLLDAAVHLPLVLPPVVTGWVLLLLFGRTGPLGHWLEETTGLVLVFRWTGAALAAAVMALPLMVRAIRLSIEAVDQRLEQAARTLGAGRWRTFRTITLPLSLPGVLAGAVLGFARALGEFGATITFVSNVPGETQTLPLAIYSVLQQPDGDAAALRLSAISILLAFAALLGSELLARRAGRGLHVL